MMITRIFATLAVLVLVSACSGNAANTVGRGTTTVPAEQEDFQALAGERVFFDYDSSSLRSDARRTLDSQAIYLSENGGFNVVIAGHADERGTREYNLALGERRASAVRDYLISKGIGGARIRTISYGKERPAVAGSNEEAWSQNRRAVTTLDGNISLGATTTGSTTTTVTFDSNTVSSGAVSSDAPADIEGVGLAADVRRAIAFSDAIYVSDETSRGGDENGSNQ